MSIYEGLHDHRFGDRQNNNEERMPHTPAHHHPDIASRSHGIKPGITHFSQRTPTTFTVSHLHQTSAPMPDENPLMGVLHLFDPLQQPERHRTVHPHGHNPRRRKH